MAGSSFGNIFRITTWGESHGPEIGVVIDGCPAGIQLSEEYIQSYLDKRRSTDSFSTPRHEADKCTINSGVFEGMTTGAPISITVKNLAVGERDYTQSKEIYRPGHADYTYDQKYGFRDYRAGGRSSGRETVARVAAGAVAKAILEKLGIVLTTYVSNIGPVFISYMNSELENIDKNPVKMPDAEAAEQALIYLKGVELKGDSAGGIIECIVSGLPAGIGNPVFDKLDANLSKAVMSIGAIKGIEFGAGFEAAKMLGSENNDSFIIDEDGNISKESNNAGGILGGISDGSEIIIRTAVKPVPSISKEQDTVTVNGEPTTLSCQKTNDITIVPRACVVVEAMTAVTLVDMLFENMTSRIDRIVDFYRK